MSKNNNKNSTKMLVMTNKNIRKKIKLKKQIKNKRNLLNRILKRLKIKKRDKMNLLQDNKIKLISDFY